MRQRTSKLTRKPRRNPLLPKVVAEEQLARSILEQAAEAIIVCDERGGVIRASQAAQRFCEGSPLLRPFAEVFPLRTGASDAFLFAPALRLDIFLKEALRSQQAHVRMHLI